MGKRIEAELISRDWSRAMLYELVPGLDDGTLSALIKRDSRSSKFAPAIANAFGVELHWLLTGEEPKVHQDRKLGRVKPTLSTDHQLLIDAFNCAPEAGKRLLTAMASTLLNEYGKKRRA